MRIDSSVVGMESARSYHASGASVRRYGVRDYRGNLGNNASFGNALEETAVGAGKEETKKENTDQTVEKDDAKNSLESLQKRFGIRPRSLGAFRRNGSVLEDLHQTTLRYILDLLFAGRHGGMNRWMENYGYTEETSFQEQGWNSSGAVWGSQWTLSKSQPMAFYQESWYAEQESVSFSTVGTVKTSDGREIHFNVDVGMSRSFEQYFKQEVQQAKVKLCDPLVINLDVGSAELKDQKFFFDLDADGEEDEIAMLGSGSGYLALDRNQDGKINDGSELFGTSSGDGFKDLARYDQDGNGWIDENDEIWSKLKIWTKNEKGEDVLYTLRDKGVGAIYLGSASTDFSLVGQNGDTNGMIRKTGIFLYENGTAGTVQHLDVAKYKKQA